ncbi:hypothetical protein SPURM210S_02911 [Streptomyces purpurascens]
MPLTCIDNRTLDLGLDHGSQHRSTPTGRLPACVFAVQGLFSHPTTSRGSGQLSLGFSGLTLTDADFDGASGLGRGARGRPHVPEVSLANGHDQRTEGPPKDSRDDRHSRARPHHHQVEQDPSSDPGGAQHSRASPRLATRARHGIHRRAMAPTVRERARSIRRAGSRGDRGSPMPPTLSTTDGPRSPAWTACASCAMGRQVPYRLPSGRCHVIPVLASPYSGDSGAKARESVRMSPATSSAVPKGSGVGFGSHGHGGRIT